MQILLHSSFPEILILVLFWYWLVLVIKDGTAKLQNGIQEIAIHSDHKKTEFSRKAEVSIESRLPPKMIWEQEFI